MENDLRKYREHLEELAADTEQFFSVSCTVTCDQAVSLSRISAPINLYRIAQEAVTNAQAWQSSEHTGPIERTG